MSLHLRFSLTIGLLAAPGFLWTSACGDSRPEGALPTAQEPATKVDAAVSEDSVSQGEPGPALVSVDTPSRVATEPESRDREPTPDTKELGFTVRDSAGIAVVDNLHTSPLWSDETAWRVSEGPILRIGVTHGDPMHQLYRVTHAQKLNDGSIAVVNSGTAQVRLYDGRGTWKQTLGGSGDGPGEFRSPWLVFQLPGDSLLVFDLYRDISVFTGTGHYVRRFRPDIPSPFLQSMAPEPVGLTGAESVVLRGHYPRDSSWAGLRRGRIRLLQFDLSGSYLGSLGDYDDQAAVYGGTGGMRPVMMGPRATQTATDSSVWYGPGDIFALREIGTDGRTLRLLRLDRPVRPITQAEIAAVREGLLPQARQLGGEQALNRQLAEAVWADAYPAHYQLMVDEPGNLWVQDYQLPRLRVPRTWTVFSPEGRYLGDVEMPTGFTPYQIGGDYVLGRWTDDLDVEYIHLYSLDKPRSRVR